MRITRTARLCLAAAGLMLAATACEPEPTNHPVSVEITVTVDSDGRYVGTELLVNGEQGPVTDLPHTVRVVEQ